MATTKTNKTAVGDDSIRAKTGKDWSEWFRLLDREKAAKLPHREIAKLLASKHKVSGWWSQMITVEYERARGLRAMHQQAGGFTIGVTKTLPVDVGTLYAAATESKLRKRWFPDGEFVASSQMENKYLNGSWKGSARLNAGFSAKGSQKAQIAIAISRLKNAGEREAEKVAWKAALEKLATLVQK